MLLVSHLRQLSGNSDVGQFELERVIQRHFGFAQGSSNSANSAKKIWCSAETPPNYGGQSIENSFKTARTYLVLVAFFSLAEK